MSVRKTFLRFAVLGVLAGASVAVIQQFGPVRDRAGAPIAPVLLTANPTASPEHRVIPGVDPVPDALTAAIAAPEFPARRQIHAQTIVEPSDRAELAGPVATSPLGLPCGLSVSAEAMPGAMVALDILEPCAPLARVTVTHGALTFAAQTDAMGLLALDVPAFETVAAFSVALADGRTQTVMAEVADLTEYDRAAIVWHEDLSLQLHASEGNAAFGEAGHVWQEVPGSLADLLVGDGGFLVHLGDTTVEAPHLAQVYTMPHSLRDDVRLSVELPVTAENCGQPVRAHSLLVETGRDVISRPVTLIIPGCDTVGEYLLLQNLFRDQRLASN